MGDYISKRLKSFGYALNGLGHMLRTQPNARIHLAATVVAVLAGLYFDIVGFEWLWLALAITLVWALEMVNTAIEHLSDLLSPEHSESVKFAKDIAAGAVLLAAILAIIIAGVVFLPKIAALF